MGSVHSIERAAIRTLMLADLAKIMRNMPEGDKMQQRTWLTQAVFDLVAMLVAAPILVSALAWLRRRRIRSVRLTLLWRLLVRV